MVEKSSIYGEDHSFSMKRVEIIIVHVCWDSCYVRILAHTWPSHSTQLVSMCGFTFHFKISLPVGLTRLELASGFLQNLFERHFLKELVILMYELLYSVAVQAGER